MLIIMFERMVGDCIKEEVMKLLSKEKIHSLSLKESSIWTFVFLTVFIHLRDVTIMEMDGRWIVDTR